MFKHNYLILAAIPLLIRISNQNEETLHSFLKQLTNKKNNKNKGLEINMQASYINDIIIFIINNIIVIIILNKLESTTPKSANT